MQASSAYRAHLWIRPTLARDRSHLAAKHVAVGFVGALAVRRPSLGLHSSDVHSHCGYATLAGKADTQTLVLRRHAPASTARAGRASHVEESFDGHR